MTVTTLTSLTGLSETLARGVKATWCIACNSLPRKSFHVQGRTRPPPAAMMVSGDRLFFSRSRLLRPPPGVSDSRQGSMRSGAEGYGPCEAPGNLVRGCQGAPTIPDMMSGKCGSQRRATKASGSLLFAGFTPAVSGPETQQLSAYQRSIRVRHKLDGGTNVPESASVRL